MLGFTTGIIWGGLDGWGVSGGLLGLKELISRLAPDYECLVWFPDMLSSEEVMR